MERLGVRVGEGMFAYEIDDPEVKRACDKLALWHPFKDAKANETLSDEDYIAAKRHAIAASGIMEAVFNLGLHSGRAIVTGQGALFVSYVHDERAMSASQLDKILQEVEELNEGITPICIEPVGTVIE